MIMQTSRDGGMRKYDGVQDWGSTHADENNPSYLFHSLEDAVDIQVTEGTTVLSPVHGTVVSIEVSNPDIPCPAGFSQLNNQVSILAEDGLQYTLSHLQKNSSKLRRWQTVAVGEPIGKVGTTGTLTTHLHMGASYMTKEGYLRTVPIRFKACKSGTYKGGEPRNGRVDCRA